MNQIETLLRRLAENFRVAITKQVTDRLTTAIAEYETLRSPGKTCPRNIWPTHGNMGRNQYQFNQFRQRRVSKYLTSTPRPYEEFKGQPHFLQGGLTREEHIYTVRPDASAMIAKEAAEQAEAVIAEFVAKVGKKLNGIVESMGNLSTATLRGSTTLQNTIRLEFADNSSFDVESYIIINHSVYGKPFNQFPTRFSNVILRGVIVKTASETKVKKMFVGGKLMPCSTL